MEYFVAVAIGVIIILILILVAVAVLLIRLCRRKIVNGKKKSASIKAEFGNGDTKRNNLLIGSNTSKVTPAAAPLSSSSSSKMPRHIQMGTGFFSPPSTASSTQLNTSSASTNSDRPDLISDHKSPASASANNNVNAPSYGTMSSESSRVTSSDHGSYRMAMENIIGEYR